jgi:hypothetical protein
MERGFYHPDRGHWQTNSDVSEEILAGYPAGTVDVPASPGRGYTWTEEGWQPTPPDLAALRAGAHAAMTGWIEQFLSQFTTGVPAAEIASWLTKSMAAQAHLAGVPQDIIIGEALLTGEDPNVLAATIQAKSQLYIAIIARMTGLRRMATRNISAANTPEDVAEALDDALATAHQLVADLGLSQES